MAFDGSYTHSLAILTPESANERQKSFYVVRHNESSPPWSRGGGVWKKDRKYNFLSVHFSEKGFSTLVPLLFICNCTAVVENDKPTTDVRVSKLKISSPVIFNQHYYVVVMCYPLKKVLMVRFYNEKFP